MTEPVSNPYKLVPVKPTEAMIDAGRSEFMRSGAWAFHRFWSAMLAASPQGEGSPAEADQDALIERTCRECRALHRIFTEGVKP